jgi:hypothetical protein
MYNFTRIKYEGTALPASGTQVLYESRALSSSGVEMPLTASGIAWVVFHAFVDQNINNALVVEYWDDQAQAYRQLSSNTISNAAGASGTEGEVYVGHFEHIRVSYTNGLTTQTGFQMNLNLHSNDRSPIGL